MHGLREIPDEVTYLLLVSEYVAPILYRDVCALLELNKILIHTNENNKPLLRRFIVLCAIDTHLKLTTD